MGVNRTKRGGLTERKRGKMLVKNLKKLQIRPGCFYVWEFLKETVFSHYT